MIPYTVLFLLLLCINLPERLDVYEFIMKWTKNDSLYRSLFAPIMYKSPRTFRCI